MEFLIGFVTVLVSFRAYDNVQRAIHLNKTRPKRDRPEDSLSLSHMEELMKSKSIVLRNAAHQILLERAQLEIPFILKQAQSKDPEKQKHALSVILELSQMDTNRTILVNHRCIKMLSKCLKTHLEPQQWRLIVMSLYHLIVDNDRRKLKFLGYSVLDRIVSFIESDEIFLSDLKHWCIILLHQLTLTDAAHHTLIQHDIINVFAEYCKRSFGNVQMQRICIHSIVRLLSSLEEEDPETVDQVFMKLRDLNMIPILANSLRKDDQELASWAIFFLHEFAHRDVLRDEIRQVKGLLKQLIPMMAQPNSIISRIILRILKCLCKDNMHFKMEIVRHNVFPKIIQSMDTSDSETQYWAISLLHELMTTPQMHQHFFHHDGLETLIAVAQANTHQAQLYISDIIALISANDIIDGNPNIPKLVNSGLVNLVLNFCKDEDEDLKYSGAALLLNLCNISDDLAKEAIELEATLVLSKFFDPSTRDATQVLASKSLLSLAQRDPSLRFEILIFVIRPMVENLLERTNTLIPHLFPEMLIKQSEDPLKSPLQTTSGALIQPDPEQVLTEASCLKPILNCLSLFSSSLLFDQVQEGEQGFYEYLEDFIEPMATALYDLATFPLIDSDRHKRAFEGLSITEEEICILSVRCLEGLLRFESVGELLHTLDFSVLICGLLQTERPRLVRNVLQSLTKLIEEPYFGRTLTARPLLFFIILKAVTLEGDPRIWADFRHFASILARGTVFEPIAIGYAHVHRSLATADIIVNHQTFEVYNRSWSFESVRCSHGVSENGKYAYEFVLGSDGIIQIGWCTLDCVFEPYTGQGVGDDQESYSFDGCRTKIWHAKQFSNNEYGSVWKSGDAVVCLLDLDQRTISFMLNGRHLGIAFTDVDSSKQWFPAASFTNEEWGRFCFGSRLDPLEFCPPDHVPIGKFEQEKIFLEIDTDGQSQSKSPTSSKSVQFSEPVTPFDGVVEADMYSPTLYPRSGIVRRERVSVSDSGPILEKESSQRSSVESNLQVTDQTQPVDDGQQLEDRQLDEKAHGKQISVDTIMSVYGGSTRASPMTMSSAVTDGTELMDPMMSISHYLEIRCGFQNLESKYQHFGIITQGVVIYTLVLFREHNTVALCKLEPQEYESDEPFSQVLDQYLDTLFDDNDAETPPFLQLLDMVHNVRIREADVLGCGIFMMRQTIFFTLNGILLGEEIRLEDKTCCVPYIRDFSRYIINYGDLPFEYEYANVDRDSILSCILDQSKG